MGKRGGEEKRVRTLETAGKVKMLQLLYLALICFNVYFTCLTGSVCVRECMRVCVSGRVHVCVISTQPKA